MEPGTRKRYANTRRPPWIKPGRDWAMLPEAVKQREAADWQAMQDAAKGTPEVPAAATAPLVPAADGVVPAMPVVSRHPDHRPKHRDRVPCVELPFSACVARPVRADEIRSSAAARAAMDREFDALRFKKHPALSVPGCWDESAVQERDAVKARARREGRTVHFGTIFGICVEKGSELAPGDSNRKFKGRFVFRGNDVRDQNWEAAMFQELGSSPAALEAGKSADLHGLFPGHDVEQCDAEQAYPQSLLGGTETWVALPRDRWPASWKRMKAPICPLRLALYGHPDAGGYWELHCERHVLSVGFVRVGDWRSCYWHAALQLFLVIYVDDFKLSGPKKSLSQGWKLLRKGIATDDPHPVGVFLGCRHIFAERASPWSGRTVRTLEYDMSDFLVTCVSSYRELTGCKPLRLAPTPFLEDVDKVERVVDSTATP